MEICVAHGSRISTADFLARRNRIRLLTRLDVEVEADSLGELEIKIDVFSAAIQKSSGAETCGSTKCGGLATKPGALLRSWGGGNLVGGRLRLGTGGFGGSRSSTSARLWHPGACFGNKKS